MPSMTPAEVSLDENISRESYFVWNETTRGENFAERGNDDRGRALAFHRWHGRVELDLTRLREHCLVIAHGLCFSGGVGEHDGAGETTIIAG